MAVTTKLSVDIGGFKSGMQEAQNSVKTLDAALKKNEAQFKATGNAEEYMTQKANLLNQKMQSQEKVAKNAANALAEMNKNGVDPASAAYQKMAQQMLNAEAAMLETQNALNELDVSQVKAADSAEKLVTTMGSISKKVSLEQVISGINSITGALEKGAQKAKELGEAMWNDIMNSARWADDTATMAMMYGIDLDTFQRMQKLFQNGMDTSVDAILNSQTKLKRGIGDGNEKVLEYMRQLGLLRTSQGKYGEGEQLITEDTTELFWEAGRALMAMGSEYDKEAAAQAMFGRGWKELIPLFTQYKSLEEYNAALAEVNVNTEEEVEQLATLSDKVGELEGNWQTLKNSLLAELAPALTGAAEALDGLLERLMEYLKSDEGQQMLERLGTAVSGLFEDLGKIDPEAVVSGFVGVFETVIGSLEWLVDHHEEVIGALEAIAIGWGALKLTGGALQMLKLVNGLTTLLGTGGGAAAGATAAGTASTLGGLAGKIGLAGTAAALIIPTVDKIATEGFKTGYAFEPDAKMMDMVGGEGTYDIYRKIMEQGLSKPSNPDWRLEYQKGTGGNYYNPNMPIIVEPEVADGAAEEISEDIGVVPVMVEPILHKDRRNNQGIDITDFWDGSHANGLWSVPYDGYLARLHRGERVIPAREVSSRNFSSNLYVESMYMNSGADANGLAAAMAAAQKRAMAGYGS